MIERLAQFRGSITRYLSRKLSKKRGKADALQRTDSYLQGVLGQVFEGILLSSSSLSLPASTDIPPSLVANLNELAGTGILLLIVDDNPEVTTAAEMALGSCAVLRSRENGGAARNLALQIRKHIDEHGYNLERILKVGPLRTPFFGDALKAVSETGLPVFVTDFILDDIGELRLVSLPVVRDGTTLLSGPEAVEYLLGSLLFARRLNIRETATVITSGEIRDRFDEVAALAHENLQSGVRRLRKAYPHLESKIFDDRSGAVSFSPSEWRHLSTHMAGHPALLDYFQEKLEGYWQPGRPCYRRILYTPTKVLLRGERYYAHMKNVSPVERIRELLSELGEIQKLRPRISPFLVDPASKQNEPWKIGLAFFDQFRNIGLQFFSFTHAAEVTLQRMLAKSGIDRHLVEKALDEVRELYMREDSRLHSFVGKAVRAYYSWLLANTEEAHDFFTRGLDHLAEIREPLKDICAQLESIFRGANVDAAELRAGDLVRRWREADHPGENLLVSLHAIEDSEAAESVEAVGIGWGGIELPLVFQYLAQTRGILAHKLGRLQVYIANWSHYRDEESPISWVVHPHHNDLAPAFSAERSIIFDDNVLSGITLERVRNEMLQSGASDIDIYVTRFSGERRWYHMQMKNHGAVDPDVMLNCIKGYIGETPFARSWSRRKGDYKSQIGVFSLARRRILECIHNNSTAEAWDREGF